MNKVLRDAVDRGHNGRDSSSEVSDGFKADDKLYFADGVRLNISVAFANEETNPPANLASQSLAVTKDNDLVIQVVWNDGSGGSALGGGQISGTVVIG